MFKKAYLKIGLIVLLLITVLTAVGIFVQAESGEFCSLSVTYSTGCSKVEYSVEGGEWKEMKSGQAYSISKASSLQIRITPTLGYEFKGLFAEGSTTSSVINPSNTNNVYSTEAFIQDANYTVLCETMQYDIIYVGTGYEIEDYPSTHRYGTDTYINQPTKTGYTFLYWLWLDSEDAETGKTLYCQDDGRLKLDGNTYTDTVYLSPVWEKIKYPVYRYDYVFDPDIPNHRGDLLGFVTWNAEMGTDASGAQGDEKSYTGYYFDPSDSLYYTTKRVSVVEEGEVTNEVYRFYLPIEYALEFRSGVENTTIDFGSLTPPASYVFNQSISIPNPVRAGYDFAGWQITAIQNGKEIVSQISAAAGLEECKIEAEDARFASDDKKVVLTALWTAKIYQVNVDHNTGAGNDDLSQLSYKYDMGVTVPNPTRKGYTFIGWKVNGADYSIDVSQNQTLTLQPYSYTSDITLVAQWKANTYTVTVDGNNADTVGTATVEVTYDAPFALPTDPAFVFPKRTGYEFAGFSLDKEGKKMYTDANGVPLAEYPVWSIAENTTLYAQWTINQYAVEIEIAGATQENTEITVTDKGTGETYNYWEYTSDRSLKFDYGTALEIRIAVKGNEKLISWNGSSVTHTNDFTHTVDSLGAETLVLKGVIKAMINAPVFKPDYEAETFITASGGTIPDGSYLITCGTEILEVVVKNGNVTVNGGTPGKSIRIPESFFGKSVSIVTRGVDGVSADSNAQILNVVERDPAPENTKDIESVYQNEDTSIIIQMTKPEEIGLYEFAYSEDGVTFEWFSADELTSPKAGAVMFEGLKPGAKYYISIRVKAEKDSHPHGLENCISIVTKSDATLDAARRQLLALIEDGDGEMVKKLIDGAIAEANALERPSANFAKKLEEIYNRVISEIKFAREQDAKIAALDQLHESLVESGEFDTNGVNTLNTIHGIGVTTIKNATGSDAVQSAYDSAVADMKAVLITNLVYGDLELKAEAGLPQGTKLFGSRYENIDSLTSSVDAAIQAGSISAGGTQMTLAEATDALRTLDVMAAYQMKLTDGSVAYTAYNGTYEIRLLLPAELRGVSGLQVAYYNEKTGELEVLDTEKDGNCLVFKATRIADFVILGDPTMNLNGFIAALLVILICQLIGIIVLLARRARSAKNVRRYSVMLPALLTIRFLPENGLTIVIVLGVLAILFQIILMYLLLTSDVIYLRKRKKKAAQEKKAEDEEALPTMADAQEAYTEEYGEGMLPVTEEPYDGEELDSNDPEYVDGGDYQNGDPEETDESGDAFAVFAEDGDTDVDGEEEYAENDPEAEAIAVDEEYDDFIEPAVTPRYSLPDEDEMYVNTETGEVYSADEVAESITEDAAWDDGEGYTVESDAESVPTEDGTVWQPTAAQWEYDDTEEGDPTEDTEAYAEQTEETVAEEDAAEETDQTFYEEPDARGDEAPAPDDFYYDPDDEKEKKYDGYEE